MKILHIIFITFIFGTNVLSTQTNIQKGDVYGHWTVSESPYNILGDINVPSDKTLIIDPGVIIKFFGYYELEIKGRLIAKGLENDSIIFTFWDPSLLIENNWDEFDGWHGIRFEEVNPNADSSILMYTVIEYAQAKWMFDSIPPYLGSSDNHGGGIYVYDFSKLLIANSRISNNNARYAGGGIYCFYASPEMRSNKIYNNSADIGGGISLQKSQSIIVNNCIYNNSSKTYGGGMCITNTLNDPGVLINNTICNNTSDNYSSPRGNGISFRNANTTIYNCIIRGNSGTGEEQIYLRNDSHPDFISCNIEGLEERFFIRADETYEGQLLDCIDEDPLFVSPSDEIGFSQSSYDISWELECGSPCIDKGELLLTESEYFVSTDIVGNRRISNGNVDIGAFEFILSQENIEKYMAEETNVYPNPVRVGEDVFVRTNVHVVQLELYDSLGRLFKASDSEKLRLSKVTAGTYLLKIYFDCDDCTMIKKIIVLN